MHRHHWLPFGTKVSIGVEVGRLVASGENWQVVDAGKGGRALLVEEPLGEKWIASHLVPRDEMSAFSFGDQSYLVLDGGKDQLLASVAQSPPSKSAATALGFAAALGQTRKAGEKASLSDGIHVERIRRILPTYVEANVADDALLLGTWLTGGLPVSVVPITRIIETVSWLKVDQLRRIVETAGIKLDGRAPSVDAGIVASGSDRTPRFSLPGRTALEEFFNEHVVDVVQNREAYHALGLSNPPGIVLEGPPGCGKTFAVEKLVAFLGWPSYAVDAGSISSPYVHETSRKVSELFREAIAVAPSIIVIDEMDAFLSTRVDGPSSQHRTEEIAEFLRRIPEAIAAGVLIIGMTNRKNSIDPAILRRGRFDHVVHVSLATENEVHDLLRSLAATRPLASDVDLASLAAELAGHPLSDADFLMREGARLAARKRAQQIDASSLQSALSNLLAKS